MAYEIPVLDITLPASGDLSADQFRFVTVNTSGQTVLCGAGAAATGVQQDAPSVQGRASEVRVSGVSKVVLGGTVAAGTLVASDANGKAVTYTAASVTAGTPERLAGSFVCGMTLDQGGAAGDIVPVLILHAGVSN